ncbi:MAG: hypothetical protein Q8P81_03795 [Nanoarchaeota archaeon]|nr:hypothetical protein [Nanoarchaeota archaeon]
MAKDRSKTLIAILIVVVVALLAIIAYAFIVSPKFSGYVVDKQIEGYQIAVLDIARAAAQCQQVPIQVSENQTINLIAAECLPPELFQQQPVNGAGQEALEAPAA